MQNRKKRSCRLPMHKRPPAAGTPCRGRYFQCRSCFHRLSRGGQQPENGKRQQHIAPEGGAFRRGIRPEAAHRPEQILRECKAQHADVKPPHIPRRARLPIGVYQPPGWRSKRAQSSCRTRSGWREYPRRCSRTPAAARRTQAQAMLCGSGSSAPLFLPAWPARSAGR